VARFVSCKTNESGDSSFEKPRRATIKEKSEIWQKNLKFGKIVAKLA